MAFSVLMSVYRKEKPEYLRKSLESVMNQTLMPDEIVLIEDGPLTEELYGVIEEAGQIYPHFLIYQFQENVQLGRALAKGVELCSNDLIARMDTDDVAVPKRFECQIDFMQKHPEIAVCGGFIEEFDEEAPGNEKLKKMPEKLPELKKYARYRNPLNHMTVVFRKKAVLGAGNYRHFPLLEDYDLWSRMLAQGAEFYNLQRILVRARTDIGLYGRRGGYSYFKRYKSLRKQQKELKLLTGMEYLMSLILSFGMTMQPVGLRKVVYQKILRR